LSPFKGAAIKIIRVKRMVSRGEGRMETSAPGGRGTYQAGECVRGE
jgi:hypothetical protein